MKAFFTKNNLITFCIAAIYVCIPTWFVYNALGKPAIGTDDANVFFVYAKNFAHGNGIVYNAGGEHVEGFSSILYFFVCSFFYLFTRSPEFLLLLYNLVLATFSVHFVLKIAGRLVHILKTPFINQCIIHFICVWFFIINPYFFAWNIVSLMDSGTYCFVLTAACYYLCDLFFISTEAPSRYFFANLFVVTLYITRPEGVLWAFVFIFCYFLKASHLKKVLIIPTLKKQWLLITVFGFTILSVTLFRLYYFHYPLPNTYYTKVSASFSQTFKDGFQYISSYFISSGILILIIIPVVIYRIMIRLMSKYRRTFFELAGYAVIFSLVAVLLPMAEGGDHFHGFRFYQAMYPLLLLPFIYSITASLFGKRLNYLVPLAFLTCLLAYNLNSYGWTNFMRNNSRTEQPENVDYTILNEFTIAETTRENGNRLNDLFSGNLPVIGYGAAGGIACTYKGFVYDMLGLNEPRMAHADKIKLGPKAHQSFNKKVFYELSPDILMPTAELASTPVMLSRARDYYCNTAGWDNLIYKNIFNDAEFKEKYSLAVVSNPEHPDFQCYGYFNNVYLQKLSFKNQFIIYKEQN